MKLTRSPIALMDYGIRAVRILSISNDQQVFALYVIDGRPIKQFNNPLKPIYDAPYSWSSTLHMPTAYTLCRSFHSRMLSALLSQDPPFTVKARKEANSDRAPLVQEFMTYVVNDWVNDNTGYEEVMDRWIWAWVELQE